MRKEHKRQGGAVAVEFAMVAILFSTLLMAIVGFGHWLFTMESVAEATRAGARVAVVCDLDDSKIKDVIKSRVPQLSLADGQISVQYLPSGCTKFNCAGVQVTLTGVNYSTWVPFLATLMPVPPFTSSLPRESLESVNADGDVNPLCL